MPVMLPRPVLTTEQRRAANFLERVYWAAQLTGRERNPDPWIDPDDDRSANQRAVLAIAFPSTAWGRLIGLDEWSRWYRTATDELMPAVHAASRWWTATTLERHELMIGRLRMTIDREPERLHQAAMRVQKEAEHYFETTPLTADEMRAVTGEKRGSRGTVRDRLRRTQYMHLAKDSRLGDPDLYRLMVHPDGVDIVDEFAQSAEDGCVFAAKKIDDCAAEIIKLRGNLADDEDLVWRYPTAIAGGVIALGIGNRAAVSGFSLAWGAFKAKSDIDSALGIAANAIFVLELVGGPLGAAIGEVLDFIVAIIGTVATFLRELEQDQAADASAFAEEDDKLAESSSHLGTVLQGVTALVAAAALPGALSQIGGSARRATSKLVVAAEDLPPIAEVIDGPPAVRQVDARGLASRGTESGISATERGIAATGTARAESAIVAGAPQAESLALTEARTTNRLATAESQALHPSTAGGQGVATSEKAAVPSEKAAVKSEQAAVKSEKATANEAIDDMSSFHDPTAPKAATPGVVVDPKGRFTVVPEVLNGFTMKETIGFKRILGKPLTSGEIGVFGNLWASVANPGDVALLTKDSSRALFDNQRRRFWQAVRNDANAVSILSDAGVSFRRTGYGTAPSWLSPDGREVMMTIDHIAERQSDFALALSAKNLQISFWRENTQVLRLVHQLDPFQ
jgi:hypothetical protein